MWGPLQQYGQGRPGRRTFEPRRIEVWRIQSRALHPERIARVRVQGQCWLPCLRNRELAGVGESGGSSGVPLGRAGSLGTHPYLEAGGDLPSVVEAWRLLEVFNVRRNDRIYTGTLH